MNKKLIVLSLIVPIIVPYTAFCQQQEPPAVTTANFKQLINLEEVIRRDLSQATTPNGSNQIAVRRISQAQGAWAASVPFSSSTTAIVTGHSGQAHAFIAAGRVRQLAIDHELRLHLLHYTQPSAPASDVSVMDLQGNSLENYSIPGATGSPFLNSSNVMWKVAGALVSKQAFTPLLQLNGVRDLNEARAQRIIVGALPVDGEYFTFGDLSELITQHGKDGSVLSSYEAPLDAAFQAVGVSFVKPPQPSDISRVIWAASTPNGLLYICLSGAPAAGPAFIAVLEVSSGKLLKVLRAELPRFKNAVTARNVNGTMTPAMGAISDQLVIADQQNAMVAVY